MLCLIMIVNEFLLPTTVQVGIRSITKEGREQGKRFGVEQFEMRTFSRDREFLENLVSLSLSPFVCFLCVCLCVSTRHRKYD